MKIELTHHFRERCEERTAYSETFVVKTFEHIQKLVRRGIIRPKSSDGKLVVCYKNFRYVYTMNDRTFVIVTFMVTTPPSSYRK